MSTPGSAAGCAAAIAPSGFWGVEPRATVPDVELAGAARPAAAEDGLGSIGQILWIES